MAGIGNKSGDGKLSPGDIRDISILGALWLDVIMKCTGVDRASKYLPLMVMGRGCLSLASTSA
jgi:hypothetical protein